MQMQATTMTAENEPGRALQRFSRDVAWFQEHYQQLLEQYPEQWVAVFNQQVVGANPDIDQLLDHLQKQGIPLGGVFIERATTKEEVLILPS